MKRSPFRWTKTSSYALRPRDTPYMLWVKTQPCLLAGIGKHVCYGPIEADHAGGRGWSRKAPDNTCVPLCKRGHEERSWGLGFFWPLAKAERWAWRVEAIAATQERARAQGVEVPPTRCGLCRRFFRQSACTARQLGECDCPRCQGLCSCSGNQIVRE